MNELNNEMLVSKVLAGDTSCDMMDDIAILLMERL